jgi:uracil-DNA glycosylase family 4
MSFFFNPVRSSQSKKPARSNHIPIDTMREMGCKACSMNNAVGLQSPKMQPHGDEHPDVYVLGGMPSEDDDNHGCVLSGKDNRTLNKVISRKLDVRFNTTIRCHSTDKGAPTLAQTECCRNSIIADIELAQPKIIVGAGKEALTWATGLTNIDNWRGKPVAVKIGKHSCWFYPVYHPSHVRSREGQYGHQSEFEMVFDYDWRMVEQVLKMPAPEVFTDNFDKGIICITGNDGRSDLRRMEDALNFMATLPQVGLDLETNEKLRPYDRDAKIITCAVGNFDSTVAFALDHPDGWSEHLKKEAWGLFTDYLLESNKKIAHNLGFEMEWLCHIIDKKLAHCTEWADTMMLAHTLDERKGINSLDDLCRQHFGFFLKSKSRVIAERIMEFPLPEILRYNGMDSKWTDRLYSTLHPMVYANKKFAHEYERKVRLEPTLVLTQLQGVDVDFEYANEMKKELDAQIVQIEKNIKLVPEVKKYEQLFGTFIPTSTDHVLKLMKDVCHRDEIMKDGGGTTSDEGALNRMPTDEVPSAPLILEHRATSKLLSTYVLPVITRKIVAPDGKIHTRFNSMIAETGRLSSDDPNLQNFPKRKHKKIRGMVTAMDGWFFPADYGQLEARVIAWASEDDSLMRALWTGYDIHGFWTEKLTREYSRVKDRIIKDYEIDKHDEDADKKIRKSLREEMKNGWVFPQFFGSSVRSCAANLKIPEEIAQDMADDFWNEFTGVKKWQERVLKAYERNLYVETLGGRRRRGALTKNQIINHPIQGTAADLVLDAMCEVSEYAFIEKEDEDFQPRLNVHDDLTFKMPNSEDETTIMGKIDTIVRIMCKHRFKYINVPVVVEVSRGTNWFNQKELGVFRSNELFNLANPYA